MTLFVDSVAPANNNIIITKTGNASLGSSGNFVLNLESVAGLGTAGLLMVRGVENNVNSSIRLYMWNTPWYSQNGTRYGILKILGDRNHANNYGNVYAYFSSYSGSVTTADQTTSSTSSSTAYDVYMRNSQGAPCTVQWTLWRTQ